MRQTSIRSNEVADLLDEIVEKTGESKVDAVRKALEMRAEEVRNHATADRALGWLQSAVWPRLPKGVRGHALTKEEQEDLLGYD